MLGYWIVNELDFEPGAKGCAAIITRVVVDRHDASYATVNPVPRPIAVAELPAIADLLAGGNTVVCCGGGGIPVARDQNGFTRATIGVVDPDATAALLATQLRADLLLLTTDVEGVYADFDGNRSEPVRNASCNQLRSIVLAPDSMGRKITAACDFVEATGGRAVIGNLRDAADLIHGTGGTQIHASGHAAAQHEQAVDAAWGMVGGVQ
jgi:carbamate kinase